ncbi:Fur family transcriptional regulator [Blastococcus saxobsidens]|uniref:Zn/Fe uptake regulator, Fur family n=1 Tax=Blastococcus saxobsidens (strain DD2) TaxID=1146883 RepID=H6RLF7_BLASD|nr:Fur family transcriptional regulator [Blastococcus saxobsidens]CCG02483.1 Zn/Fe uptake regulator, Fur family [Blastococcus saxobsidens DD2]
MSGADQQEGTGRRPSRQRSAVLALLDDLDGFSSAQDLHALLRERGDPVGLATVYRALQALVDDGQVDVLRGADGEAAYRRCSLVHHHHLVCRSCGTTVEVADPPVERWARQIAAEHGFADVQHQVEVFGTCRACTTAGPAEG